MKHIALAGNPNCGKTTLFNALTGATEYVGNWPGVTVEKKEGIYKKSKEAISIVDLPGIYSLSPYTPEEVISRNYLLEEKPDCILNIIDATNLERNLYLTTQLMELDIPIVIALNMMDIVRKNGDVIQTKLLIEKLGIPVIEISAFKEENLDELMNAVHSECDKKRSGTLIYQDEKMVSLIKTCQRLYQDKKVSHSLFHAIKLLEHDEIEVEKYPELASLIGTEKANYQTKNEVSDYEAYIADQRYRYISSQLASVKSKEAGREEKKIHENKSDRIDKVLTNRWAGIPIFLVILFLIFHLTFSTNLFFLGGLFENVHPSFEGSIFEGMIWTDKGINSLGVILQNFVTNITDWITSLVSEWCSAIPEEWVGGLICDGILGGLFSVISFLPQILLLFLFFSILEDSGYMSRVAFILDRIFRKFGLSGRSFMPMIMGFGCSVPAMINTRTLADEKERVATIRVIPFFSCGAKLPILTAIAGGIVQIFGIGNADLITYSMYLLGMVTAIIAVIVMRKTTMRGEVSPFIMELPAYHMPRFKSLMIHLWDKLKHFVKKAFTIILASTIIIWFLSHFSWNWTYLPDEEMAQSILASLGQLIQPMFTPLGFGSQLQAFGWVFAVAVITGLVAKEQVIGTFGILAACIIGTMIDAEADGGLLAVQTMIQSTGITPSALIAFIAFNMLTIPCFAAVATAKAELPKNKFKSTLFFWLGISYLVSSMIYVIGSWWWTCFIYLATFVLIGFVAHFYIKKKDAKLSLRGD